MAELVGGALLGKAVDVLYEKLKKLIGPNLKFGSNLKQIRSSLDSFKPYIQKMTEVYSEAELQGLLTVIKNGEVLVGKCLVKGSKWNLNKTSRYAEQLREWDESLKRQLEILNFWGVIDSRKAAVSLQNVEVDIRDTKKVVENSGEDIQEIKTIVQRTETRTEKSEEKLQNLLNEKQNQCADNEAYCAVPELPAFTVGLDLPLRKLKEMMFEDDKSMIVVNAMGGSGKTTLAISFCRDPDVKERFESNIFFVTVSENFNLELIVQQLHQRKCLSVPAFSSQENAVTWLQRFLKKEEDNPLLLVLDDVWSESESFLGNFQLKEMKDHKILVTSRSELLTFSSQDCQYKLKSLNAHDAMQLFSYSTKCSDYPELSKVIVESCNALPLGLTVVGGSLSGKPMDIWLQKKNELSKGVGGRKPEDKLYHCLQRSLDDLDEKNKEYFLDLGAFPDHKRISVGALIDMWAEIYDDFDLSPGRDELIYEEEDTLCNAELMKLNSCNLANLVDTRKDKIDEDRYRKGNYVSLHDLLKNLAIRQSGLEPEEQRKRLIIDIRGNNIPKWWRKQKHQAQARLVSVSTDGGFTMKLPNMTLTEAEVLILNFRTRKYILPEFVENMPELKVLLVKYDGSSCAELDNFQQLCSLPSLKRITLESLSIWSITESHYILKSLVKLSLILCDLSLAISNGHVRISDALPKLEEMIIDRCYNCDEFLTQCCDLVHLTKLSIINCHNLLSLPERIGSLVNLELLRLRSCSGLKILPDSVANLKNLMFLDISECSSIGTLPVNIGEMSSLTKLDLRHCQDTDKLRHSVSCLEQLKELICTSNLRTKKLWEDVKPLFGRIRILVLDLRFSSGLESANFILASDPVHLAWKEIEKQRQINPNAEPYLFNVIQQENCTIVAFGTPLSSLQGQEALESSNIIEDIFAHSEFLCSQSSPNFSLSQAAIRLFESKHHELLQLKQKLVVNSRRKTTSLAIITGHSVGGTLATLFTLWLLQGINLPITKRPLCVTFGSPLVGDCDLKFSTWKSCFLHIVSMQDPTPQLFVSLNPGAYRPFGTFLICSASGCACFEDPDIILELLTKTNSQNRECDYGQILSDLKFKALCKVSKSSEADTDSLQASFITQLQAIGILSQQQPSTEIHSLVARMEKHETELLLIQNSYSDLDKKLNEMKVYMAFLDWYKKDSRLPKIGGYYDRYRNQGNVSDVNVNENKKKLMNYWEDSVTEVENKPQIEGVHLKSRWLWAGTNYRRMVEPLHIAGYYKDGGKNYKTAGKRPKHFILLEEWLAIIDKPQEVKQSKRQNVGASLTEDSCFWARVEDARILCSLVKDGSAAEKESALQELKSFEADVYASLKNYALSPEIFLEKSSFMQWCKEYKGVVEQPYSSLLLDFMKNHDYEEYKEGEFI